MWFKVYRTLKICTQLLKMQINLALNLYDILSILANK